MRIGIISTMEGYSWGGSEELWYRFALRCIHSGHEVNLSYGINGSTTEKLIRLTNLGAKIFFRRRKGEGNFLVKRLTRFNLFQSRFTEFFSLSHDLILVSLGSSNEIIADQELISCLLKAKAPFYLLSQFNSEYGVLSDRNRKLAVSIYSSAKHVFFVSLRNKEIFETQIIHELSNASIVNNPVSNYHDELQNFPVDDVISFAMVARLHCETKGQDTLFRILGMDNWKSKKWVLNLYGEGPDKNYLFDLSKFLGIEDKIRFKGSCDLVEIWSSNALLLMPSRAEGTPLALLEAMAAARPSVASNVGGIADFIEDGVSGFLSPGSDLLSFNNALERAWGARSRWKEMGMNAREILLSRVDPEPEKFIYDILL